MNMVKLGPKEMKGTIWDEIGNTAIVQILISYDRFSIISIQFVYAEKAGLYRSQVHGKHTGPNFNSVLFDYPSEFLTSVSGKYSGGNFLGNHDGKLTSITFGTNKREIGPFGMPHDPLRLRLESSRSTLNDFNYEFGASDFGGFHGCVCNFCIWSIGIYVRVIESLNPTNNGA